MFRIFDVTNKLHIHFQVLDIADEVEEARNDTIKLDQKLDSTVHELNNTVQDELQDLGDEFHEINNTVQDELHDLNNTVQDGLHDLAGLDKNYHELDGTVQELNNTVQAAEIYITKITG